ncbi:MAG: c-type cytochrome [Planctomycetes bacterium]|nr:c-type cytochrome [Planctomycetota bacterium]
MDVNVRRWSRRLMVGAVFAGCLATWALAQEQSTAPRALPAEAQRDPNSRSINGPRTNTRAGAMNNSAAGKTGAPMTKSGANAQRSTGARNHAHTHPSAALNGAAGNRSNKTANANQRGGASNNASPRQAMNGPRPNLNPNAQPARPNAAPPRPGQEPPAVAGPEKPGTPSVDTGEPQWIWAAGAPKDVATCYFRKSLDLNNVDTARVQITADDRYELYVNGRLAGKGSDWHVMQTFDITKMLVRGRNCIAVKVDNTQGTSAALVARVVVRPKGSTELAFSTDASWRARTQVQPGWERYGLNDSAWPAARSFGELGSTAPWGEQVRTDDGSQARRFQVTRNFRIERVIHPDASGSLIAMAFNEWGEILISRERGPLMVVVDKNKDGLVDSVETYCEQITSVQGMLPLNGQVFAVGEGPDGAALYRLSDEDNDGTAEKVTALVKFTGGIAEHGPHAVALGPDGLIYVMIGNHASAQLPSADGEVTPAQATTNPVDEEQATDEKPAATNASASKESARRKKEPAAEQPAVKQADAEQEATPAAAPLAALNSPYHHPYEGDLLTPKYEDANGHAVGIKAPCGTVIRTDADGNFVQVYAGGLRNAYDMAFDGWGELFTYDSDMEWDAGLPWYRQTRVFHVPAGAELGSRSGWSPWPQYFLDGLPGVTDTGRGSPTGVESYQHTAFPPEFRQTLFLGDWSQGRILAVHPEPKGAGYTATTEVFVAGQPLNITDLGVGPDGWLYFVCGGRGSEGGVYRVVWTGKQPPQPKQSPIAQAIRQPQPNSAWGRQRIAMIQEKLGADWDKQIVAVALDANNRVEDRLRAMMLMPLYGPDADATLIERLAADASGPIRAKAAWLAGIKPEPTMTKTVVKLVADADPLVRRQACEAIARGRYQVKASSLVPVLGDADRTTAWAAYRAIQNLPVEEWRDLVLDDPSARVFLVGSAALLPLEQDRETSLVVLTRARELLKGYLSDGDFLDLMRVAQLALIEGKLKGKDVEELRKALAEEYPSGNADMNRELVRVLCYLQAEEIIPRLIDELNGKAADEDKIHTAMCARFLRSGWDTDQKLAVLEFYELARTKTAGYSYAGYLDNVARDFCTLLNPEEREKVLAEGAKRPTAALNVLATLEAMTPKLVAQLIDLDDELAELEGEPARRLQTGIVALLAGSGQEDAMDYLRRCFEKQPDRRLDLAMGLSQQPGGDNWPLLMRSLPILEAGSAQEVLMQLTSCPKKPEDAETMRQAILLGLRLGEEGKLLVPKLLDHWTDQQLCPADAKWDEALEKWQKWFAATYPELPAAELPAETDGSRWTYQELLTVIDGEALEVADASLGALVFEKAQCAKCHRYAGRGEGIGPDLSTVSQRFQKKEILRALLFPSEVISDQYAGKVVTTTAGKTYTGIVGSAGTHTLVVLQSNGQKVTVPKDDVEEMQLAKKSIMPDGLLDNLTQEEIANLVAYLTNKTSSTPADLSRRKKAAPATGR